MTLKQKYESAVMGYVKAFEKKQDCELDYWVGDVIGGGCGLR